MLNLSSALRYPMLILRHMCNNLSSKNPNNSPSSSTNNVNLWLLKITDNSFSSSIKWLSGATVLSRWLTTWMVSPCSSNSNASKALGSLYRQRSNNNYRLPRKQCPSRLSRATSQP